jgi:hypothetical protein
LLKITTTDVEYVVIWSFVQWNKEIVGTVRGRDRPVRNFALVWFGSVGWVRLATGEPQRALDVT